MKRKNIIIKTIMYKIKQSLITLSDDYHRHLFKQYLKRKAARKKYETALPQLNLKQKKEIILDDQRSRQQMQRVFSEEVLKNVSKEVTNSNLQNQESTQISAHKQLRDSTMIQKQHFNPYSFHKNNISIGIKKGDSNFLDRDLS